MSDGISNFVYRDSTALQTQLAAGLPVLIPVILHVASVGMGVYLFILLVKLANKGIKLLDIYIKEKTKYQ